LQKPFLVKGAWTDWSEMMMWVQATTAEGAIMIANDERHTF